MHPNLALTEVADFSPYPWMRVALREYGICRAKGPKDNNPRVLEYLAAVGLTGKKGDDEAWCSAFANWCMRQAGIRGSMGGLARSWLTWGGACLAEPVFGAVTVLARPPNPNHGHVSFYVGEQGGDLLLLGGNQTVREGAVRINSIVSVAPYPRRRVLGYRWLRQIPVADAGGPVGLFPASKT